MHDVFVADNGFNGSFQAPNTCNMLFLHIIIPSVVLYKENITLKSLPANIISLKDKILGIGFDCSFCAHFMTKMVPFLILHAFDIILLHCICEKHIYTN